MKQSKDDDEKQQSDEENSDTSQKKVSCFDFCGTSAAAASEQRVTAVDSGSKTMDVASPIAIFRMGVKTSIFTWRYKYDSSLRGSEESPC